MTETKEQLASRSHITELVVVHGQVHNGRKLVCSCGYKEYLTYDFGKSEDIFRLARIDHANNVLAYHLGVVLG